MQKIRSWCTRHPNWTLAWLTAALLLPFCAKPFNLDDPLFIWVAKQIQAHPADPFGFTVNWGLTAIPMWKATENPPLACYYLALAGGLLGWSEVALHLAFILPAVGVVLGTHRLARHFCGSPMLAALAALCTPVFMISSLTLMSDVLMLAFWVWAVIFWVEGLNLPHPAGLSSDLSPSPALPSPLPSDGRGEGQGEVRVPKVHGKNSPKDSRVEPLNPKSSLTQPIATSLSPQRGEGLRVRGENYLRPPFLSREVHGKLFAASILISLAALTKYYGICLVPLLGVYTLIVKRRLSWTVFLLVPLAIFAAYQWAFSTFYGPPLSQAAGFSMASKNQSHFTSLLPGLAFTGGCLAVVFFAAPLLWRKKNLALFALTLAVIIPLALVENTWFRSVAEPSLPAVRIQLIFWALCGVTVLALVFADLFRNRDARAWLLALWVLGTFIFATFVNWTIDGRCILPMAPAVGILLARKLETNMASGRNVSKWIPLSFAASAVFALMITRADYLYAVACRQTAREIVAQFGGQKDNVFFEGHWGYQFYLEAGGFKAFDVERMELKPGNVLANADYNTLELPPDTNAVARTEFVYATGPRFLTTMDPPSGAGFYASIYGPLPFAFGPIPPERVRVYFIKTNAVGGN